MAIVCKFKCVKVTKHEDASGVYQEDLHLEAVYDDTNKSWSQWTPCGGFTASITNPAAFGQFTVGEYYRLEVGGPAPAED